MNEKILMGLCLFFTIVSCAERDDVELLDIVRVDSLIYDSNDNVEDIKNVVPLFFTDDYNDSMLYVQRADTLMYEAYNAVKELYDNKAIDDIRRECASVFYRYRKFFPKVSYPTLYTYMSHWDFTVPLLYVESENVLVVYLDLFLGAESKLYSGIYDYIRHRMDRKNIAGTLSYHLAQMAVGDRKGYRLIDYVVHYGKVLYLKSLLISTDDEENVLDYTADEYHRAVSMERAVWDYYVRQGLLFKAGKDYAHRFFDVAPYSVFYTANDKDIPWGIGRYVGYKMVKSYMDNNPRCSIDHLMSIPADSLLRYSGYNPHL
ncbi:MAG: hypothetical protein IIW30_05610 [Flavobacteriales bacterium]|nr:hypothetical protein [Flavobacteriales bacterium]